MDHLSDKHESCHAYTLHVSLEGRITNHGVEPNISDVTGKKEVQFFMFTWWATKHFLYKEFNDKKIQQNKQYIEAHKYTLYKTCQSQTVILKLVQLI